MYLIEDPADDLQWVLLFEEYKECYQVCLIFNLYIDYITN